jgi:hypothetical protein
MSFKNSYKILRRDMFLHERSTLTELYVTKFLN